MNLSKIVLFIAAALTTLASTAPAIVYSGAYAETFDSMGTTGTALPAGYTYYVGETGTTNATWSGTTGIVANGASGSVASMVANTVGLTATTTPNGTNINGFNAAASSTLTADRVAVTSPTSVSGAAFQLTLTNTTGTAISALNLGYSVVRYTAVATANELPGYEVFLSLDGTTWTNVAAFNTSLDGANGTVAVPNTTGTTLVLPTAFALPAAWASGSDLLVRWVDDNAVQTSPDQIIGLNNVVITNAVPEPSTWTAAALGAGLLGVVLRRRSQRVAHA